MAYAWSDLFYENIPGLLRLHAAVDSGEDLATIRNSDGSMSILDGVCFFEEWDFIEEQFYHLSQDDSRRGLLNFESTLSLTRRLAQSGIPVVRKLAWEDFVTCDWNCSDILKVNHRRVLIAIAAGRGPVLRHLFDTVRQTSLLDEALEWAGQGLLRPECEYLRMVEELVSAEVPLRLFAKEDGWPTPFQSLFFDDGDDDTDWDSVDLENIEPWSWPPSSPRPHSYFRQRLGAVVAAGLSREVQLLEGPGDESYLNTHFVQMVLTDTSIDKTADCIMMLRILGATTRLAIGDVRHTLQVQIRNKFERLVALGDDQPHLVHYDEQKLWRHAVIWHRSQEAWAQFTSRTLSVCLPSNAVAMIDAFLLGERVPLYRDSLRICNNGNPEYFEAEGGDERRDDSTEPDGSDCDGIGNAECEAWREIDGQGMDVLDAIILNTDDVVNVIEQVEHAEPPAQIPRDEAALVAACIHTGFIESLGPSVSSSCQASGYEIHVAVLNRNTKEIRKELSEGISLRHYRQMLQGEGHEWKLKNGGFIFIEPWAYRQAIAELKGVVPELTPSHIIFSSSAEPNLKEALQKCNGFHCLKASPASMTLDSENRSDIATIGDDEHDARAGEPRHGPATFTLDVVRTFISVQVDVSDMATTKSTTDLYCLNPRRVALNTLSEWS